jgi:nucleoside-diphosphate-sugar epimerase
MIVEEIDAQKPILVTGASGYMASWITRLLLEEGRYVKATVRDKSNMEKVGHLLRMGEECPGTVELFEADLLKNGSFEAAMADCELVIHNASPFKMFGIKDPQKELIEPALEGTRDVLTSATRIPSVKRIVLTSSYVAVYGDAIDIKTSPGEVFTESDWNTTSTPNHQPYYYSKTVAEKEAWRIAGEQTQWDLVVVNPGFVLGPSLTNRTDSFSIDFMLSLMSGRYKRGVPDRYFGVVDVRDVAIAHLLAGTVSAASGRHILVADTLTVLEITNILRKKYGDYPLPKRNAPRPFLYLFALFQGIPLKNIKLNVGIPIKFDNSYSRKDLGIEYTPVEKTLHDHAAQIIESGLLKKKS